MTDDQVNKIINAISSIEIPDNWSELNDIREVLLQVLEKLEAIESLLANKID